MGAGHVITCSFSQLARCAFRCCCCCCWALALGAVEEAVGLLVHFHCTALQTSIYVGKNGGGQGDGGSVGPCRHAMGRGADSTEVPVST
ncbi:hypothetical protein BZA05DRAFT_388748 [Tricharina praecox]|uniref:uncharacterized protein n=1 Tax=Tricharina praecox TaxID=43433 RepID=UPI00221E8112|nr:uncharacterized protein BZA05DRAFT_388748 [Tricharina praecox]KAI5856498.1 hypothetical protein BZA05DRAFT_388748 [Tricharina praecox]